MALRQAQEAVKAAIADGNLLIEVDLPIGGRLCGVSGDTEGQREMNELSVKLWAWILDETLGWY